MSSSLWLFVCLSLSLSVRFACSANDNRDPEDNQTTGEEAHECDRVCISGSPPKTCYYDFFIEWYFSMSNACGKCPFIKADCYRPQCIAADGQRRALITTNRKFPGPAINVCEGDRIKVKVKNRMDTGEGTTIHWHGLQQRKTPFMDGTHLVTQCPIPHMADFMYDFKADVAGTYFWHSHTALQRGDGLHGSLVIRSTQDADPHWGLYDHDCHSVHRECEHILLIADFLNHPSINRYNYFYNYAFDFTLPTGALINGRNSFIRHTDPDDPTVTAFTPREVFEVEVGKNYRFRTINSVGMKCPFKVSVEGHTLKVIASDGRDVEPIDVDAFMISPGERYDFVLAANQAVGNYWVKIFGFVDCEANNVSAYAILRYKGAAPDEPMTDPSTDTEGKLLNALSYRPHFYQASHGVEMDIPIPELNSTSSVNLTEQEVDTVYFIGMDYHFNDKTRFDHPFDPTSDLVYIQKSDVNPVFNNITFKLQSVPPLTQPDMFDESLTCNKSTINITKCVVDKCACTHMLKFPLGHVVELVLVDEGKIVATGHPIHLHGFHFWVLGSGRFGDKVKTSQVWDQYYAGNLKRKLVNPPLKDTITVPDGGYVIIRFVADNPGIWNMHCHRESHNQRGQALIVQVGERSQFPPIPPGFPRCGSWDPDLPHVPQTTQTPVSCPKPPPSNAGFKTWAGILTYITLFLYVCCMDIST